MYSDNRTVLQLVALLRAHGIRQVVVSPGSRHFSLIRSLENDDYFRLYSVVDERSAGFFAIGLIHSSGEPVALCCTSGTAAANYTPSVAEAFYQKLPLLVLTADRSPQLLNQMEDQMMQQVGMFSHSVRYGGNLPEVRSARDEWYVNRVTNEALLRLRHGERGPVHLNFVVESHSSDRFSTATMPAVRVISRHSAELDSDGWQEVAKRLEGRRILIVWGQSVQGGAGLGGAVERFARRCDAAILTDRLARCPAAVAVDRALPTLRALSMAEQREQEPEIVISVGGNVVFNGEIKSFLNNFPDRFCHWQVGLSDGVCDPYQRLTDMFVMSEEFFLDRILGVMGGEGAARSGGYAERWAALAESIPEPNEGFSQLSAIGAFLRSIPPSSSLHIANSNAIRMCHLFRFDRSVQCYGNRGVNGIDGSVSSAVGLAAERGQLVFLVIGDLSFFYDMNALWNCHRTNNLRILLVNNGGGAVMHLPFSPEVGKTLGRHVSAEHGASVRGWVESCGFRYLEARDKEETGQGINTLTDVTIEGPIVLEVFTNKEHDTAALQDYWRHISRVTVAEKVRRRALSTARKALGAVRAVGVPVRVVP